MLLFIATEMKAQKMLYKAYVVLNAGDTVKGKMFYDIGTNNNYHVVNLQDDKGFVRKFNVWQIKMYCMNNEYYYTKKTERGEMQHRNDLVFMHLLKDAYFKLYEYEYTRKVGGAREFEAGGFTTGGEKDYYVEDKAGVFTYFPRINYKKILENLLAGNDSILASNTFKNMDYKDIPEIIELYNQSAK
jgi:hypothetical protein